MLSKEQKNLILTLMKSPFWPALKQIRDEILDKIDKEPKSRDTEWETIRAVLGMEGERQGIVRFFQELDAIARNSLNE